MTRNFISAAIFSILAVITANGQNQTPKPSPTPEVSTSITTGNPTQFPIRKSHPDLIKLQPQTLEVILAEAEKQTRIYRETFKNLLADEKKTFERFNKNGEPRDQTVVESTLLVYQSPKDQNVSTELRNVVRVDGRDLPDSQKRSELLFAELQKTSTVEKELEKIQDESLRYDKTLEINGLTVSEALVLSEKLRPFFEFRLGGTENFQGNEVYVVNYQQTRKSPYISINAGKEQSGNLSFNFMGFDVPRALRNSDAFLRGKLWIDAKTFRIWREERELTIQTPTPVVLLSTTLEYQPSDYEILVPKRIILTANDLKRNENQYAAVNDTRVTFDYSKFRKTDVDVKIIDDEP